LQFFFKKMLIRSKSQTEGSSYHQLRENIRGLTSAASHLRAASHLQQVIHSKSSISAASPLPTPLQQQVIHASPKTIPQIFHPYLLVFLI
jgi:hypothetical protein